MTPDDVVEAMAVALADINGWSWHMLDEHGKKMFRNHIRAAIRALPPGWVVAEVPGDIIGCEMPCGWDCNTSTGRCPSFAKYNAALAAVRGQRGEAMSAAKWRVLISCTLFFSACGLVIAWLDLWSAPSFVVGGLFGCITVDRLTREDSKAAEEEGE